MKKLFLLTTSLLLFTVSVLAQNGSSNCSADTACYDTNYAEIKEWATAGRKGGIPNITKVKATLSPGDNIQNAIDRGGAGVVLLNNGTYTINSRLNMKDGVVLRGRNKRNVKLSVKMKSGRAITFGRNTNNAGIENLRMVYEALPNPPVAYRNYRDGFRDGAFCRECFNNDFPQNNNVFVRFEGSDNWVDNVDFINSGSDPVEIFGNHNTFRNSLVDNCYNKGGGGEGYFDIRGDYNLVIGSTVRLIRHFAIQNGAKYNVIYDNEIEVDINFHNGDDGRNLIESNNITRPSWHTWGVFATGGARYGHDQPGPRNIIFNNTTFDHRQRRAEFSTRNVVYTYRGYGDPDQTNWSVPKCGSFYAVKCNSGGNNNPPPAPSPTPTPTPAPAPPVTGNNTIVIEAERFTNTSGVFDDALVGGPGKGVSATNFSINYVNSQDYVEYSVTIQNSGTYAIEYQITSPSDNGQIQFSVNGNLATTTNVPNNGSWDNYSALNGGNVTFNSGGNKTIRITASGSNDWQWNLDKITLTKTTNAGSNPSNNNGAPIGRVISLRKSGGDRKFVSVTNNFDIKANAGNDNNNSQRFRIERNPRGGIALKSLRNNKYVQSINSDKSKTLKARGENPLSWERFEWNDLGNGKVALRSLQTNGWVQASWRDNNARVLPRGAEPKGWETFEWRVVSGNKILDSNDSSLISIYPNPKPDTDHFVNITGLENGTRVSIVTLNGAIISSQLINNGTITTTNLATGIYFIKTPHHTVKLLVE
ncbi:carbohydrate-binding protein [Aquimarina agarivorans]|uniref:carbohydrate-binding protein n=1 Tax=Aquimarina agarivorans TaxID=980584 RepID=UPI000248EA63|nr:carbohydrate-binding protein [Aquimarina agarivorans]